MRARFEGDLDEYFLSVFKIRSYFSGAAYSDLKITQIF